MDDGTPSISLPRLQDLTLINFVIFEKLDISPDAHIRLILEVHPSWHIPVLLPTFTSTLQASEVCISLLDGVMTMEFHAVRPTKKFVIKHLLHVVQNVTWITPSYLKLDISQCHSRPLTVERWTSLFACLPTLESMEVQPGFGQDGQEAFGDMVAASLLISALNKPESEQAVGPKLRRLVFPAFDRNQLTEDFLETVKACEESRESRGRPYVDIILGASLASGV